LQSAELRREADLLDFIEKDLVSTYAGPTGLNEARVGEMIEIETWMGDVEAKELGFATAIAGETNAIPVEYLAKFEHVSAELLPKHEPKAQLAEESRRLTSQRSEPDRTARGTHTRTR
jgi:hypothetical protein